MIEGDPVFDGVAYLKGIQNLFPDIRPYDMDDWDWTWADEGYQFLEACDFGMAELTFQRLIAARPQDPDGYEGLAMVYKTLGIRVQACVLIDEALRLAQRRVAENMLDQDVLNEIGATQKLIHAMPDQEVVQNAEEDDIEDP